MRKIIDINTISQYNTILGEKTLNPLVSIVDLSKISRKDVDMLQKDFYTVFLKEYQTCKYLVFGRTKNDYCDATIIFLAPGEILNIEKNSDTEFSDGQMLLFHPYLLKGTSLGMHIDKYTFFNYNINESLHLSMREKRVVIRCIENIKEELLHPIDKHSQILVTKSIDILLGYCARFYERQFITRSEENKLLMKKNDKFIYNYYTNVKIKNKELLTAQHSAKHLNLSPAYFIELLNYETGHTVSEYMQFKQIEIAKKWLGEMNKTVTEIAYTLGFSSPEYFKQLFKKLTGFTPIDFNSKMDITH